jgi:hypothetical protein
MVPQDPQGAAADFVALARLLIVVKLADTTTGHRMHGIVPQPARAS